MTSRIVLGAVAAAILIAISYFTARMYSVGFRFNGVTSKLTFFGFLLIPLVFAGSIITTRSLSWGIGPFVYSAIQVLAGVGLYLFFGAIVLGVVQLIGALLHTTIPSFVTYAVLAVALMLAVIGFVQARVITVTSYSVTLPNAPESWNGKKAVLVTDTHFGLVNGEAFSEKVVNNILALQPDFVLHGGDFYDGPAIVVAPFTTSWQRLTSVMPVFYAPGNHELYGQYDVFINSIQASGVTILDNKVTQYDGVNIAGITYRSGKDNPEAVAAIENLALEEDKATILINHPPTALAAAAAQGVDLQVSGHTHNGQFWPLNYVAAQVYGAFVYGLHKFANTDMDVITSRGVGTFGPPFRTFNQAELVLITFKTK